MIEAAVIIALIMSIVLHEMAHGYAANWLGDPTARLQGRLSPNPLVHIDLLGSIIVPALLFFGSSGLLFGWAKPVPYNPYNLRNAKWGEAIVAAAGPLTNIVIAIAFALLLRMSDVLSLPDTFLAIAWQVVFLNIVLAFFNMIPIPPLDGSKILMSVLPFRLQQQYRSFTYFMESAGLFAMFAFIFIFMLVFARPFFEFIVFLTSVLTGVSFV